MAEERSATSNAATPSQEQQQHSPPPPQSLKHLGFVEQIADTTVARALSVYQTLRSTFLPRMAAAPVDTLEHALVCTLAQPLLATGAALLHALDDRVDAVLARMQPLRAALRRHMEAALSPATWEKLTSNPSVSTLLRTLQPAAQVTLHAVHRIHDNVVPSPYYKAAYDLTVGTWSYATTTTPYKLSARYLYPVVEPLAEPAIARARESGAVDTVVDYWTPTGKKAQPAA